DENKLNEFLGKVVGDVGSAMSAALVVLGDQVGLWRAMAAAGPVTSTELARRSETTERYVREWLNAMAASGYVSYDAAAQTFSLPAEHAIALTDSESPAFVPGLFQVVAAMWAGESKIAANFRTGGGLEWGHQHPCLFEGTERFFRSGYLGNLIQSWLPSLTGVVAKLERGAKVADVGCGVGASTIIMAKAYPKSTFFGFDYHAGSIEMGRQRARDAGVSDRVVFEVAKATDFPGKDYDLIAHFDCLHDLEDPNGAATHARQAVAKDGTWMIVEPFASDRPEQNHNPVGRVFYSASTMLCVPHSLSQGGPALGAQAGEAKLRDVVSSGGFAGFRRATETPFNLVLEARP
ncbi:MAG TPA: class I SAM-dependent methyltransferase, partial [Kofleriaceae bacterium]|nr:class I SAM-dependent methyltransferase [Kofleriaceae bacterium]